MQRFFVPQESIQQDSIIVTDESMLHQMGRVIRMNTGDKCIFLDNSGDEYFASVKNIEKKIGVFTIQEKRKGANAPKIKLTLIQAISKKPETFELILQKGTELGVFQFVPIIAEFCNRRELLKRERLERIILEAAEQSERTTLPALYEPMNFTDALTKFKKTAILLHCRGELTHIKKYFDTNRDVTELALFIGPEGGFSPGEISLAQEAGIPLLSLGNMILRTETAAIVAVGAVQIMVGDEGFEPPMTGPKPVALPLG